MAGSRVPGPLDASESDINVKDGTMALMPTPTPHTVGTPATAASAAAPLDENTRMLAAVSYGEGSTGNVFEEMAAIANVLVRQQKARGYASISAFIKADKTYAFAAHDGNQRYGKLFKATDAQIAADAGMAAALRGATNALSAAPVDHSNGAYFWDGADIKSNYDKHPKVRAGIKFSDPKHNIYGIEEKQVPGEEWWRDAQGNKTKLRGKWDQKYVSTAAWGGTVFWKYDPDFVKASGNKEHD